MLVIVMAGLLSTLFASESIAAMSFPPGNSFGTVSKTSSGELRASIENFTLDAGDQIFVHVAKDNLTAQNGETSEIVNVEDSLGNVYVKIKEYTNGQRKKLAGVTAAMFVARTRTAYPSASPEPFAVTVHFAASTVAKAMVVQRVISDCQLEPVATAFLANNNANPGLIDLEVPDEEHLWVRTMGIEGAWVNFFETAEYYDWGTLGTYGGGGASNIAVAYEADVLSGTSNPSDPTSIDADSVSILAVFGGCVP